MQKKIIALAIAGLASTAAFAQSNVTIYGSVDVGFVGRSGDSGGVQNTHGKGEMTSGGSAGNRLGFKGVEDLGNGLKALFELEYGFSGEENSKPGFNTNRHAYVGLTGNFGTVVAGRLDGVRYGVYGTYDPFANGSIGNFTQMTVQYDRANNAIAYISPNYSGFGLVLAYATNTQAAEGQNLAFGNGLGNNSDDQLFTIMGTYDNGPISARLDYETTTLKSNGSDNRLYVATAGLSYDFGVVKVSGVYDIAKGDVNSFLGAGGAGVDTANVRVADANGKYSRQNYFLAASVPLGKFTLMGNIGRVNNKEQKDADATKFALGARYALSKRTYVYTAVSHIKNDDNATFQISQSAASNGTTGALGVTGYELGLRHQF